MPKDSGACSGSGSQKLTAGEIGMTDPAMIKTMIR